MDQRMIVSVIPQACYLFRKSRPMFMNYFPFHIDLFEDRSDSRMDNEFRISDDSSIFYRKKSNCNSSEDIDFPICRLVVILLKHS